MTQLRCREIGDIYRSVVGKILSQILQDERKTVLADVDAE